MTLLDELKQVEGPITRAWMERGEEKGLEKGLKKGLQQALLTIFENRNLPVSARLRARILACTDAATLDRWIARALTARQVPQKTQPRIEYWQRQRQMLNTFAQLQANQEPSWEELVAAARTYEENQAAAGPPPATPAGARATRRGKKGG